MPNFQRTLSESIHRWSLLFVGAIAVIGALAIGDFVVERMTADNVAHTGQVLQAVTSADRAAWDAESAVRKHLLQLQPNARQTYRTALDSVSHYLAQVVSLTARSEPVQRDRAVALRAAVARWDSVYGQATFAGGSALRDVAIAGTFAFDDITRLFDEMIVSEGAVRTMLIERQRLMRRITLSVLLLSLLVSAWAFWRVARVLRLAAERVALEQRQREEQAAELELQTAQLHEQTGVLEEQATELEHRLEERERTNRLLERTAAFLDSAVDGGPVGIAFFDTALRYQRVNRALAVMTGRPPDQHIGRTVEEIMPEVAPRVREVMQRVLSTGRAESDVLIEGPMRATDDAVLRWLVTFYPIASHGREPLGVGVMAMDVTERLLLEEQLRQSQKMEAVGRLAGGIAHDFNNILTIIQSYAELLIADVPEDAPGRMELEAIRGAADRATALSRQLLAFSRREVVIPRDLDLNAVIAGMEGIVRRLLRQGIELELELHREPLTVRIDPGQLEQVLMNLAFNAVDAMPGGGTLRIITERRDEMPTGEGLARCPCAVLRVHDTGAGMSKEVQARLFEPFFTTKPAGEGTGLGLATAYAIVNDAKGFIQVSSTPGVGSDFEVFLPITKATLPDVATVDSGEHRAATSVQHERILIAEDEPAIRQALSRVLRDHGYEVIEAANGGEALRLADAEPGRIDLLLTDIMMPGIGGKELVDRLRATRPDIRVVLMSGYTDDESLRAEIGASRQLFLQKPFSARAAVETVRKLLDAQ